MTERIKIDTFKCNESFSTTMRYDTQKLTEFLKEYTHFGIYFTKEAYRLLCRLKQNKHQRYPIRFESNSLDCMIQLLTGIKWSQPINSGEIWLISSKEDSLLLHQIEELFKKWFEHQFKGKNYFTDFKNLLTNPLFVWRKFKLDNSSKFQTLPVLISTLLAGKTLDVYLFNEDKKVNKLENYPVTFYPSLNRRSRYGNSSRMYSQVYKPKYGEPFMFFVDISLQTTPVGTEHIVFNFGVTILTNSKERCNVKSGQNRTILMFSEEITHNLGNTNGQQKVMNLEISKEWLKEPKEWKWNDIDNHIIKVIASLVGIKLPNPVEIIRSNPCKSYNGYCFGLVHHTQDFKKTRTKPGIGVEQTAAIFKAIEKELTKYPGLTKTDEYYFSSSVKYYPRSRKYEKDKCIMKLKDAVDLNYPQSIKTLEKENNKKGISFEELLKKNSKLKFIVFLPPKNTENEKYEEYRGKIKKINQAIFGVEHSKIVTYKDMPLASIKGSEKTHVTFRERLKASNINKEGTNMVIYPLESEDYYRKKDQKDPRARIKSYIIESSGIPKQYNLGATFGSRYINTVLGAFRMMGLVSPVFTGFRYMNNKVAEGGMILYKLKSSNNKLKNYYLICSVVDQEGSIHYSINGSRFAPYNLAYKNIYKKTHLIQLGIDSKQISSIIRKTLSNIQSKFGQTIVALKSQKMQSHIYSMSNKNFRKDEIVFKKGQSGLTKKQWPDITVVRVKKNDEIPWFFKPETRYKNREYMARTTGLVFLKTLESNSSPSYCYSIASRSHKNKVPVAFIKQLSPTLIGKHPNAVEFAVMLHDQKDDLPQLYNLLHLSRSIPVTTKDDVKYPLALYMASSLKNDIYDILNQELI